MFKAISTLSGAAALGLAALYSPSALACDTDTDSQWECLEIETSAGSGTYNDHTAHTHMDGGLTFQGYASMFHPTPGTISNCTLTVIGAADVDPTANRAYIDVTSANSAVGAMGESDCAKVSFSGFNWSAYDRFDGALGIDGANHGDVYNKHGDAPGNNCGTSHPHNACGDLATVAIHYDTIFGTIKVCEGTLEDVEFGNDVNGGGNKNDPSFFRFSGTIDSCEVNGVVTTDGVDNNGPFRDVNAW